MVVRRHWPSLFQCGAAMKNVDVVGQPHGKGVEMVLNIGEDTFHRYHIARVKRVGGDEVAIELVGVAVDDPGPRIAITYAFQK